MNFMVVLLCCDTGLRRTVNDINDGFPSLRDLLPKLRLRLWLHRLRKDFSGVKIRLQPV